MPLFAIALVAAASVFHVAWNSLVKTSGDPVVTSTRAMALGALVLAPVAAVAWLASGRPTMEPAGWAIGMLSGIVEVAYFVQLSAAYRRGAMSAVYPVARGTGAVLGASIGILVLGERLTPLGLAGVGLLLVGIAAAAIPGATRAVVGPALLTGCAIAGYSALDRVGVRMGPAWLYAAVIWSVAAIGLVAYVAFARRDRRPAEAAATGPAPAAQAPAATSGRHAPVAGVGADDPDRAGTAGDAAAIRRDDNTLESPGVARSLAAGLLMIATYMLVLVALQVAPLSAVGPLRESGTVLAAAWGVVALRERDHAAWRIGGAVAVASGAVLLAVGG